MDYTQKAENLNFYSDPSYEYTIKAKKKFKEDYKPYSMVGVLRKKTTRKEYMDIFDRITSVSKAAAIVFNEVKANTDPETGIAIMSEWKDYDANQRRSLNKKLAELKKVDVVLKLRQVKGILIPIEKYSYMINPYLMKPWEYANAKKLWKAMKGESE